MDKKKAIAMLERKYKTMSEEDFNKIYNKLLKEDEDEVVNMDEVDDTDWEDDFDEDEIEWEDDGDLEGWEDEEFEDEEMKDEVEEGSGYPDEEDDIFEKAQEKAIEDYNKGLGEKKVFKKPVVKESKKVVKKESALESDLSKIKVLEERISRDKKLLNKILSR